MSGPSSAEVWEMCARLALPSDDPSASKVKIRRRPPRRPKARAAISADPAEAENRYINREQLRELIPASDMTIWRWQGDPEIAFPLPHKLGGNGRNFWWLPEIRAWMKRREAAVPVPVPLEPTTPPPALPPVKRHSRKISARATAAE
jgi:predicted DNA-binding transcriptional regulator AlpA